MTFPEDLVSPLDRLWARIERRLQLARGRYVQWRGAKIGVRFGIGKGVTIVQPRCFAAGDDVSIMEYSYLECLSFRGVRIGNNSSIDRNLWLSCGTATNGQGYFELGSHSFIGAYSVMGAGGGISIGDNVLIGQNVNIHAESHCFNDPHRLIRQQGVAFQGVRIEEDVWVGSKATILDGVVVGRGAVVGAGAVVVHSVPPFAIVAGVPARIVGYRTAGPGS